MARYGSDFNSNRGYGWNREGRWGGSENEYDTQFNRGRFAQRGGRFGSGAGRGFSAGRFDENYGDVHRGAGYGGGSARGYSGNHMGGGFGGRNFDDYGENRFGGYGDESGSHWGRGYGTEDRWGSDVGRGFGRTDFREGGMYGGGMYGRGQGGGGRSGWNREYDHDLGDRIRSGWNSMKRNVRDTFRGYDRGW